jgi:hypothetical protein
MSRLDDAVRSVPAGPSPANDPTDEADHDLDAEAPEPTGNQGDGDQQEGEESTRTVENVRGEALRKIQKVNDELRAELEALRSDLRQANQYGVPQPQPANDQPKTMDDMSVQELEALQQNVPEDQKEAFREYLIMRRAEERATQKFQSQAMLQQAESLERKYNEQAVTRWPSLQDKSSDFYRTTDRILSEMGETAASNPRAVLDAANEAGLELGIAPAHGLIPTRRREPGNVAPGRSTADSPRKRSDVDMAEIEKTGNRLANALPNKKFTKEQLKRIAERTQQYKDSINTRVRG